MQDVTQGAQGHGEWMARGTALHAQGQLEKALMAFEHALALVPADVNTASACATLLSLLQRPAAAYRTLLAVEDALMASADGAANLAIAAEACGDIARAGAGYTRALQLDADHVRSLNNLGFLAASTSQWDMAISLAQRCLAVDSSQASHHLNLSEYLASARQYHEALAVLDHAIVQFPGQTDLVVRQTALLAFSGDWQGADAALATFAQPIRAQFDQFTQSLESTESLRDRTHGHAPRTAQPVPLAAFQLYLDQAFRSLSVADWRGSAELMAAMQQAAASSTASDWREAAFYGLSLALDKPTQAKIRRQHAAATATRVVPLLPAYTTGPPASGTDHRLRIGLAVKSLTDERQRQALLRQLSLHDASRFAIHVYAFTAQPQLAHEESLRTCAASVSELGHMSHAEAAARIRLDRLHLLVEMGFDSAWEAADITAMRVAPLQIRQFTQSVRPGALDCILSDPFIAAVRQETDDTALASLPCCCWLATASDKPSSSTSSATHITREQAGLPPDMMVLCSLQSPAALDSFSFSLWMKILRSLPDAVLWLPHGGIAAAHLVREAEAAGVGPGRLIFSRPVHRAQLLASLAHADLLLDTLRINHASGIEDALHCGVIALTCAGDSMAASIGGSLLHAAGLPNCVMATPAAYVAEAVRLGRQPAALQALSAQVTHARATAPFYDLTARVAELEAAWVTMCERAQKNLAPTDFSVPSPPH